MQTIPVPDDPHRRVRVAIDGVAYFWAFNFEARSGHWYVDVLDALESPILLGARLTPGWNPLMRTKDERLPAGTFWVQSTLDLIGRDGFTSGDASFVYYDEDETATNAAVIQPEVVLFEVTP